MSNGNQFGTTAEELEASIAEEEKGITLKGVGEAHLESYDDSLKGAKYGAAFGPYGALIGGIAGGVQGMATELWGQRYSESEKAADQRLLNLLRQAEAGELGLTDAEQQEIFGRLSAPTLANERAAQQQALQAAASQDVGAGAFFRGAQQEETARAQKLAGMQQVLLQQDLAKRAQQEKRLEDLLEQRATRLDEDAFDADEWATSTGEAAEDFANVSGALFEATEAETGEKLETAEQAAEAGTALDNLGFGNAPTQSGGSGELATASGGSGVFV